MAARAVHRGPEGEEEDGQVGDQPRQAQVDGNLEEEVVGVVSPTSGPLSRKG